MELTEWLMLATFTVSLIATLILPFILRGLSRQDTDRQTLKAEIHNRMDHLDSCLDDVRAKVLSEACTRADFAALEARLEGTMNRMRAAISSDTSGLHDRIFRLENVHFHAGDD